MSRGHRRHRRDTRFVQRLPFLRDYGPRFGRSGPDRRQLCSRAPWSRQSSQSCSFQPQCPIRCRRRKMVVMVPIVEAERIERIKGHWGLLSYWVRSFAADDCAIRRQAERLLSVRSILGKPGEATNRGREGICDQRRFASGQRRHHEARSGTWGGGRDRSAD